MSTLPHPPPLNEITKNKLQSLKIFCGAVTVALLLTACPSPDSDSRGDLGDDATAPPTNQTGTVETAPPDNDRRSDTSRMPWEGLCAALRESEAAIDFINHIGIEKIVAFLSAPIASTIAWITTMQVTGLPGAAAMTSALKSLGALVTFGHGGMIAGQAALTVIGIVTYNEVIHVISLVLDKIIF